MGRRSNPVKNRKRSQRRRASYKCRSRHASMGSNQDRRKLPALRQNSPTDVAGSNVQAPVANQVVPPDSSELATGPWIRNGLPTARLQRTVQSWAKLGFVLSAVVAAAAGAGYLFALMVGALAAAVAVLATSVTALAQGLLLLAVAAGALLVLGSLALGRTE